MFWNLSCKYIILILFHIFIGDFLDNESKELPVATEMCNQPLDFGIGDLRLYQWYYNYKTNSCTPFHYRGIGGNDNKFETKNLCQAACMGITSSNIHMTNIHDEDEEYIDNSMIDFETEDIHHHDLNEEILQNQLPIEDDDI